MINDYDAQIAAEYDRSYELPYRRDLEMFSVLEVLGDVRGQAVLDLACGTGFYSRQAKQAGAARVVGIDLSEEMISVAREIEREAPLGLEYLVHDVGKTDTIRDSREIEVFDVAVGVYLLHYATSAEHLAGMCRAISSGLRPGGRFVGWQVNGDLSRDPRYYEPYGIFFRGTNTLTDGNVYYLTIRADNFITPEIPLHYWSEAAYEVALRAAGFSTIQWRPAQISPGSLAELGAEFWDRMIACPLFSLVQAHRALAVHHRVTLRGQASRRVRVRYQAGLVRAPEPTNSTSTVAK